MEESGIFSHRRRMPPEYLLFLPVTHCHDFWRVLCSPLGEQMGHLKILNLAFLAQVHPPLELIKAKQVFPVLHFHIDQLGRGPFQSYRRIQRRGKQGRKHHITASFHILAEIILKYLPVFFRKYVNLVIICQAICMHPFGMYDLLLWQAGANYGNLHYAGAYCTALFLQADFDRILTGSNLFCYLHVNPQASPLVGAHDCFSVL